MWLSGWFNGLICSISVCLILQCAGFPSLSLSQVVLLHVHWCLIPCEQGLDDLASLEVCLNLTFLRTRKHLNYCLRLQNIDTWVCLKLPSLFSAWPFWTFHTKSHDMKALVILNHSWSPFLLLTCLYEKKELLWVSVQPSCVFS